MPAFYSRSSPVQCTASRKESSLSGDHLARAKYFFSRYTSLRKKFHCPMQIAATDRWSATRRYIGTLCLSRGFLCFLQTDFFGQPGSGPLAAPSLPADDKFAFDPRLDKRGRAPERTSHTCTFFQTYRNRERIPRIFG